MVFSFINELADTSYLLYYIGWYNHQAYLLCQLYVGNMPLKTLDFQDLQLQIRRALAHLYDPIYLQRSPLVPLLRMCKKIPPDQEAKALRRLLLEAITQLAPSNNIPFRSEEGRSYAALRGRYIDQMAIGDLADELGISVRQLHRDLSSGLEALTRLLAQHLTPTSEMDSENTETGPVREEIEVLRPESEPVNLCAEVRNLENLTRSLAANNGVRVLDDDLPESIIVHADRVVLRQVLLALCSGMILQCAPANLHLSIETTRQQEITLILRCTWTIPRTLPPLKPIPAALLDVLHGQLTQTMTSYERIDRLSLPRAPLHTILLVDDNHSLHQLLRRYLTGLPYEVYSAYDAASGLTLAREQRPEAIIVDIMMPNSDGWEFLHALKDDADLCHIPILICSVLDQVDLAETLGAAGYIKKPFSQDELVNALRVLNLTRSAT
jgi:CheY-like chemotaxis protein